MPFLFFAALIFFEQSFIYAAPFGLHGFDKKIVKSSGQLRQVTCHGIRLASSSGDKLLRVEKDGKDFTLVPTHLVGDKLYRYFSRTSKAVVAMSCCQEIQLHRRCLQNIFHADQHTSLPQCPGCLQEVTRSVFAQSRACYVVADYRKKDCDACHQALGYKPVLKK